MIYVSVSQATSDSKIFYKNYLPFEAKTMDELGRVAITHSVSSFIYGHGVSGGGEEVAGHKAGESVIEAGTTLLFDFDGKSGREPVTLEWLQQRLGAVGAWVGASRSWSEDNPHKWHVIVLVDRELPMDKDEFERWHTAAAQWLGFTEAHDPVMKVWTQQLAPSLNSGLPSWSNEGEGLNMADVLAAFVPVEETQSKGGGGGIAGELVGETVFTVSSTGEQVGIKAMLGLVAGGGKMRVHCLAGFEHDGRRDTALVRGVDGGGAIYHCSGGRCGHTLALVDPQPFEPEEEEGELAMLVLPAVDDLVNRALGLIAGAEGFDELIGRVSEEVLHIEGLRPVDVDSLVKSACAKAKSLGRELTKAKARGFFTPLDIRARERSAGGMLDWIYVEQTSEFVQPDTGRLLSRSNFNLLHSAVTGEAKPDETFIAFGGKVADKLVYLPDQYRADEPLVEMDDGQVGINTYRPVGIPAVPENWKARGEWKLVRDHIEHLFVPEEARLVIQFMAHNVQFPGRKIRWALLMKGAQGDGKTTISRVLNSVMPAKAVKVVSNETLQSAFTGWAMGACVLALEEVRAVGHSRHDVLNKLKPIITNDMVEIVRKGKDGFEVPNVVNIMAMTNHADALPVGDEDRRFAVVFTRFEKREEVMAAMPREYFDKLYEVINSSDEEVRGVVRGWLLSIDLSGFDRHGAPEITESKLRMAQACLGDDEVDVQEALESDYMGICEEFVDTSALNCALREQGGRELKSSRLSKVLTRLGWEKLDRKIKAGGRTRLVYFNPKKVPDRNLDNEEIREKLAKNPHVAQGFLSY